MQFRNVVPFKDALTCTQTSVHLQAHSGNCALMPKKMHA